MEPLLPVVPRCPYKQGGSHPRGAGCSPGLAEGVSALKWAVGALLPLVGGLGKATCTPGQPCFWGSWHPLPHSYRTLAVQVPSACGSLHGNRGWSSTKTQELLRALPPCPGLTSTSKVTR